MLVFLDVLWLDVSVLFRCIIAVSYTHLDVYKRQGKGWGIISIEDVEED